MRIKEERLLTVAAGYRRSTVRGRAVGAAVAGRSLVDGGERWTVVAAGHWFAQ